MTAPVSTKSSAAASDPNADLVPIVQPYLLVLFSVPFYVDADARRWIDPLWAKDLLEHTRYIRQLTLVACAIHGAPPSTALAMDQIPGLENVRCVELPRPRNILLALAILPRTCVVLWREIGRAALVHTAVAGWPLAEAWLIVPLLWLRRRILFINVESAFWRLVPGEKAGVRQRVRAVISERLNRYCIGRSDISTFTHDGYRRSLLTRGLERGHIFEASWIDEANVLTPPELDRALAQRSRTAMQLRIVFAGRLTSAKGIFVLLDAMVVALRDGVDITLDVFGEGPMQDQCALRVRELGLQACVRLRGSVPYDQRFFDALREHDVLVVPTLSDEQPRIVFDAYSQGLPVIASRTDGLAQCVEHGVTGWLVEAGDGPALQAQILSAAADPEVLAEMARTCLDRARRLTHQHMHRARWRLLIDTFPMLAHA